MTDFAVAAPGSKQTLQAVGNSLPQLFENAARELLKLFVDPQDVGEVLREKIVVEGADTAALFQAWIEALLNLTCQQNILFKAFRFQIFDAERKGAGKLRAEITGELVDPVRHQIKRETRRWRCERVRLINSSTAISAEIDLKVD